MLRTRMAVLQGQTEQVRLPRTPPGEVVARSMDADRYARYADRWVDFVNGLLVAAITAVLAGTWIAGAVLLAVMATSALASVLGRPAAGRSAAEASTARAAFGRALVSALESMRTVKLAAATPSSPASASSSPCVSPWLLLPCPLTLRRLLLLHPVLILCRVSSHPSARHPCHDILHELVLGRHVPMHLSPCLSQRLPR